MLRRKHIINCCLVLAAAAAVSFEYFPNRWIPGSVLIASGCVALSVNLYALSRRS
jgi:hypothetical protein